MSENSTERPALALDTIALLESWLRGQEELMPPVAAPPDVTALTRYLSDALPADAARAVERGVVSHPAARRLLRQVRACLDGLQRLSWAEAAERAKGDDADAEHPTTAQVAQAWLDVVAERVVAATRAREWWREHNWAAIRQQTAEGVAEAQAAWTVFVSCCQQLRAALRTPRLGLARGEGEEQPVITGEVPADAEVVVTAAEVTHDGALRVTVHVRDANGNPSTAAAGKPVHLSLLLGGEAWEVASGVVVDDHVEWDVPAFGEALGLPVDQIPAHYLHISFGRPALETRAERVPVLVEVVDAAGQPTAALPAVIEFVGEPRWKDGQFTVTVAILAETRAAYRDHALCLDVIVSERGWQRLGAWRLDDWEPAVRTLTAPCPGSPDAAAPSTFLLRTRLQK